MLHPLLALGFVPSTTPPKIFSRRSRRGAFIGMMRWTLTRTLQVGNTEMLVQQQVPLVWNRRRRRHRHHHPRAVIKPSPVTVPAVVWGETEHRPWV